MLFKLSYEERQLVSGGVDSQTTHEVCVIFCRNNMNTKPHFDASIFRFDELDFGYSRMHEPDEMTSCVSRCEFPPPPSSHPEMDRFILFAVLGSFAVGYIGLLIGGYRNGLFR